MAQHMALFMYYLELRWYILDSRVPEKRYWDYRTPALNLPFKSQVHAPSFACTPIHPLTAFRHVVTRVKSSRRTWAEAVDMSISHLLWCPPRY